mgnify:CR=1 FL=1
MTNRIVIALGGNAILTDSPTASAQMSALNKTAKQLIPLVKQGHQIVITHGNGPQVGNLLLQQETADSAGNPALPLDTCVAMTQGSMGYWLQNALTRALKEEGLNQQVVSLVSQVVVDANDPAFAHPAKPSGPFYSKAQVEGFNDDFTYIEDAGRGYRRVVPSPKPLTIIETPVIKHLLNENVILIVAGGGGIPVIETDSGYEGTAAVVDKDYASAKLAAQIGADELIILTAVDYVYLHYNQANEQALSAVSVAKMKHYIEEKHFASGSMLPKVEAAISFVEQQLTGKAVITSLDNLASVLQGGSATVLENR